MTRLAQKVVDNLGVGAKSSRFLRPCTQKIELGILIEEVSPRSTNIQSERVAFYLTLSARFFVYKGGKVDYFPYMDEISTVCITASLVAMLMASSLPCTRSHPGTQAHRQRARGGSEPCPLQQPRCPCQPPPPSFSSLPIDALLA